MAAVTSAAANLLLDDTSARRGREKVILVYFGDGLVYLRIVCHQIMCCLVVILVLARIARYLVAV